MPKEKAAGDRRASRRIKPGTLQSTAANYADEREFSLKNAVEPLILTDDHRGKQPCAIAPIHLAREKESTVRSI
jgi:hypothetical protein